MAGELVSVDALLDALAQAEPQPRAPDPVGAAARVLAARKPLHAAMRVAAIDVAAMAERLSALEAIAAQALQLLLKQAALGEAPRPQELADHIALQRLAAELSDIRDDLAARLAALGYRMEDSDGEAEGI